jgi:RNA polymerase sigma factor (sigma-70 family)
LVAVQQQADAELVERARSGAVDAYDVLVRRYQELAFRTAYFITGDAADAEEVAQDALTKAYYALDRFRAGAPFRPWLLQIVANEARNRRKSAGRRAKLALRAAAAELPGRSEPSPEGAVLATEQRAAILAALDALRDDDRQVIACRYFLDLSEAEMATILNVARGTVKSRLSRALGRLRGLLPGPDAALPTDRKRGNDD